MGLSGPQIRTLIVADQMGARCSYYYMLQAAGVALMRTDALFFLLKSKV